MSGKPFRVFVDDQIFYHPNMSQLALTEAVINEDAESIDSFTLGVPYNHPYISMIEPLASTIICKKGDTIVFQGRAIDAGRDFYNSHTWTCESCLAYLKDTQQPPYDYSGTLSGLLEYFIGVHNSMVEEKKQFVLGNVTVTDSNDYIAYSNSDYSTTMDAISEKLIDNYGGYLQVRYEDDLLYLDYLADFNSYSLQTVKFGKNLLDVKITFDHTERCSALIPRGAAITETDEDGNEVETGEYLDITSVNDGVDYVYDQDTVDEIGWIWTVYEWEDVTLASNLLTKAKAKLAELTAGITSMELTIVDESDTDADIGDIRARQYVYCYSEPHGIDGTYLVLSRSRDYLNPSGNTITIGAEGVTLTGTTTKNASNLQAQISSAVTSLKINSNAIAEVDVEYYLSESATELVGGEWSTTAPTWVDGMYMWSRTKTTTVGGSVSYSDPVCISGAKGSTGDSGSSFVWNLLPGTKDFDGWDVSESVETDDEGFGVWSGDSDQAQYILAYSVVAEQTLTLSFWFKTESPENYIETGRRLYTQFQVLDADAAILSRFTEYFTVEDTTDWQQVSVTQYIGEGYGTSDYDADDAVDVKVRIVARDEFSIKKIKLEYGSSVTTWTPHPDDLEGVGITAIVEQYYLSTSSTECVGGEWSEEQPTWEDGYYIWTRSYIYWDDGTETYTDPVLATVLNDLYTTTTTLTQSYSSLEQTMTDITAIVGSWTETYGVDEDGNLITTITDAVSTIQQTAESITLTIENNTWLTTGDAAELYATKSELTATAESIQISVSSNTDSIETLSSLIMTSEEIRLQTTALSWESTYSSMTENGALTCTSATISGTITTESGLYKTVLTSGMLKMYYDSTYYGSFASTAWYEDSTQRGIAMHLEPSGSFISFSQDDDSDGTYTAAYIINYGLDPSDITQRNIFYSTTYFSGAVTCASYLYAQSNIRTKYATYLQWYNANSSLVSLIGFANDSSTSTDTLYLGSTSYQTFIRGSILYLGSTSYVTYLRGSSITVSGSATFGSTAYMNSNVIFANSYGVKSYPSDSTSSSYFLVCMNSSDQILIGNTSYTTFVRGSTLYLGNTSYATYVRGSSINFTGASKFNSAVTLSSYLYLPNGYGLYCTNSSDSTVRVLYMDSSDNVNLGSSSYPGYMLGSYIYIGTAATSCVYLGYNSAISTIYIGYSSSQYVRISGSLYVNGSAYSSDIRLKRDVEALDDRYLTVLDRLKPSAYYFRDDPSKKHAGFIAQDVLETLEEAGADNVLVSKDADGMYSLDYNAIIPILVAGYQRLRQRITALEGTT